MGDRRISNEELIEEIRRLAQDLQKTPTAEDMREEGVYSYETYRLRFEGWNEALDRAGLEKNRDIPDEQLLVALREFTAQLGRVPTQDDMNESGPHSVTVYQDRFGSWLEAREAAGLPSRIIRPRSRVSDWELLQAVQAVVEELEHQPSPEDIDRLSAYDSSTVVKRFAGLQNALRIVGESPESPHNERLPELPLLIELRAIADLLDRTPKAEDIVEFSSFSTMPYNRAFGGVSKALREAGLDSTYRPRGEGVIETECSECATAISRPHAQIEPSGNVFCSRDCFYSFKSRYYSGENHWAWKGHDVGYGPNWLETREVVIDRDNHQCQECGKTEAEQLDEYGQGLSVHHIRARREFDDLAEADTLDNLKTVCTACHLQIENQRR